MTENYWKRGRVGRRTLLARTGAAGAGLAGLAVVGCGDDDDDTSSGGSTPAAGTTPGASATAGASETPKKGGELLLSLGAPTTQTLDPHKTFNLGYSYYGMFLSRLISLQRKTVTPYQPELVESWEQVDKTTYTFKVRQGVTWHEGKIGGGRAVTADDIAFNLMRIAGKTDPTRAALYQRATNLFGMDSATAVDASTVKITFTTPNSAFLAGLGDWRNWAIAKEHVDKDPDFKDIKNIAGTGPFVIDSFDTTTLSGKYVANPKYFKTGTPYLASVQQISLQDTAATLAAFLSGKVDFLAAPSKETRDQVIKQRPEAVLSKWENLQYDYIGMNQTRAPFTDVRVRQAMYKAIDYTSLLEQEYGKDFWVYSGALLSGLPGAPSSADVAKMDPYNPATKAAQITDAKALMSAAGFADGNGVSFKIMPSGSVGAYYNQAIRLQDQLTAIWPKMKIELAVPVDGAAFSSDSSKGNYDMISYTAAPPPDAVSEPAQRLRTNASRNYTKFSDQQIDSMVDGVYAEFDPAARAAKLEALRKRVEETVLNISVGKFYQVTFNQKRIKGFPENGPGSSLYAYEPGMSSDLLWIS